MSEQFSFGAFPLGIAGTPGGLATGPPDNFDQIGRAFEQLRGGGPPLLARMYVVWFGVDSTDAALGQVARIAAGEHRWELALCYRDERGDVDAFCAFVDRVVREFGDRLEVLQVTSEANLAGIPSARTAPSPGRPRRSCAA